MNKSGMIKILAAFGLGFTYQAFGACKAIYSNYSLNSDVYDCFEIYGANVVFNGNGHKIYGSAAQASDKIIKVRASNVTVKNADIDCNTKLTGIDFGNAGNSSRVSDIRIRNCSTGILNAGTGLDVTGISDGGSNMLNNYVDVLSNDQSSNHVYTYYLDGFSNGTGFGVYTGNTAYYDSYSIFYLRAMGMAAIANSFFWLNHTSFFLNTNWDLYLVSVPAAYLTKVSMSSAHKIMNSNSKVITN
jgi:hypothetical protein